MSAFDLPAPAAPVGDEGLRVRLLPATAIATVAPRWRALETEIGNGGLTCGWDWVESWLNHYGDLVPHSFAAGERDGEPRAFALVTQGVRQRRGPIPVRTVHLGTAGAPAADSIFVEYNRLLVAPAERDAFARGLLGAIRAARLRWDELVFDGFVPEDAAALLAHQPGCFIRRESCPTTDLDQIRAGGGDVIAALGKNTRYQIRRSLRGFGEVETEWAETTPQGLAILDELIALHQARWTAAGQPGAFASRRFTGFHRELIARLLPRGAAYLFRVQGRAGTIGCLYGFIEQGRILFYQSGFGHVADDALKPGLVSHALCMQAALERGVREYDFLQGEARYKRQLATVERELVWAVASRPGLKKLVLTYARRRRFGESRSLDGGAGAEPVTAAAEGAHAA